MPTSRRAASTLRPHPPRRFVVLAATAGLLIAPLTLPAAVGPAAAAGTVDTVAAAAAADGQITANWTREGQVTGASTTVTGVVSPGEFGRKVVVERAAADGEITALGTTTTQADGSYRLVFTNPDPGTFDHQVRALATDFDPQDRLSAAVRYTVEQVTLTVTAQMSRGKTTLRKKVLLTGTVGGDREGATVQAERKVPGGWQAATRTVRLTGAQYRLRVPSDWYGAFAYRVVAASPDGSKVVSPTRRLTVAPNYRPAGRAGAHSFFIKNLKPRWNPCAPIRYKVNLAQATPGALRDVKGAFRRVREATGLRFIYTGKTSKIPQGRASERYPAKTELIVAWARPQQSAALAQNPSAAGVGGPVYYTTGFTNGDGTPSALIVKGSVVLNSTQKHASGFGRGYTRGELLMHEIAHATGLHHTMNPSQIMYPVMQPGAARWGRGDLAGLAQIGAGQGCVFQGGRPVRMAASQLPRAVTVPLTLVADVD